MTIYQRTCETIEGAGVAAYYLVAKPTVRRPVVPETYAVYTRILTNSPVGGDNRDLVNAHYVRVDIYSPSDPTLATKAVRAALIGAGYMIRDERDLTDAEPDGYHIELSTVYYEEV